MTDERRERTLGIVLGIIVLIIGAAVVLWLAFQ